jgi:hypothetical protein
MISGARPAAASAIWRRIERLGMPASSRPPAVATSSAALKRWLQDPQVEVRTLSRAPHEEHFGDAILLWRVIEAMILRGQV